MTGQIRWRLTFTYLIVIFIAMSILGWILSYLVERQFVHEVRVALNAHAQIFRSRIEESFQKGVKPGDLNGICRLLSSKIRARITVLDKDGAVLGDSENGLIEAGGSETPESIREPREGFGCRICHSEVRDPRTITVAVPVIRGGKTVGAVKLSASLYEAKQAAARTRRIILASLVVTSLIVAGVTMRLAASIAEPVSHMNEMARCMASGDLSQRVQAGSRDEVGQLAESLNLMADHLQANLDQLDQERDKMETILTSMADGIVVTDRSGAIILFNRAAERLFGFSSDQVIGKQIEALTALPEIADMARRMLSGGKPLRKELRTAVPADRILDVHAAAVHDRKGDIAGSVCILADVTEVRRQAGIRKDFVANVSHELRTPVASIRALVEALQSGAWEDSAVAERFLNSLDAEAERLSLLLNDLLNLSELESGKTQPKRAIVPLKRIAEEAAAGLSEKAKQYAVRVSVDIPPDMTAYVDKRQMLQVLQNLIDNAVKYTGEGGSVDITGAESDGEVMLSVRDTGVGIPPSDLDRIFERFYRVDKARSRQLGGTGLGLSIVRDIVDAHGGRITVDSQVGAGSTFTIALPKVLPDSDTYTG
ncbi:MAG TPA: ATP-binding protein [Armatimonadota bacterium]|nr:ATP-binding protein [Armatimonadota bacterium]